MSSNLDVAVLVGSIRKDAFSRKLAHALLDAAPPAIKGRFVDIADLPLYSQDYDSGNEPEQYAPFRATIKSADAVLFVTPEHNRSIPAALKNALDIGSRPYGKSVWSGKPAGVVSMSLGGVGGFGANHHLRQVLTYLNMPAMAQPEAYVGGVQAMFDESGKLVKEDTRTFLASFMQAFETWVGKTKDA